MAAKKRTTRRAKQAPGEDVPQRIPRWSQTVPSDPVVPVDITQYTGPIRMASAPQRVSTKPPTE